ncbi:hypothetical protein B5S29_g1552 [[Candida] boidinii]|nr:hypothetical protein B5S29_g1552 [[Candida] boidinii]
MPNVDISLLISKESVILKEIIETLGSIDKKLYISQKEFFNFLNSKVSNNSIDNPIHVSILDTQKLFKLGKNLSSNINDLKLSNYKGNEPALKKNLIDIITKTLIVLTSSVFINNIANERENSNTIYNKDNSVISGITKSPNSINNNYHSSMSSNASRLSSINSLNSNTTSTTAATTTGATNSPFNNNVNSTTNSLSALTIQNIYNNGPNHSNTHSLHNNPLHPHSQFNSSNEQQIKSQHYRQPTNKNHLSGSSDLSHTPSSSSNTSNFTTYNNYNINTNGDNTNTTSSNRHLSKSSISTNNSINSVKILTSVNKGYGIYQPDNRLILRNVLFQLYSLLNLIESSIREHFNESLTTGIFPNLLHNLIILVNASIISKLIKILQISSKSRFKFQSEDLFKSIK